MAMSSPPLHSNNNAIIDNGVIIASFLQPVNVNCAMLYVDVGREHTESLIAFVFHVALHEIINVSLDIIINENIINIENRMRGGGIIWSWQRL